MKKLFTFIAIISALSILAMSASALTLREDGKVVELIVNTGGDYDGIFILEMSAGLELTRTQSPGGALVIHNPENNRIGIAGLGLEAGDALLRLTFDGEGTYSLTGESGDFEGMALITGTIGEEVGDLEPQLPNEPNVPNEPQRPEENPKAGVALTSGAAIAAVAVAAIALSRRRRK